MNYGSVIFLGVFATFVASWWGMIFAPQLQLGSQQPKVPEGASMAYPTLRPGVAAQGHKVYVAAGCVQCHSQQVRQQGYVFDVLLTGTTNQQGTAKALYALGIKDGTQLISSATDTTPQPVRKNISQAEANRIQKTLTDSGATAPMLFIPIGADIQRGWGFRQSVAQDYLYENPVQIGNSRLGPDLTNIGARQPDAQWHLRHLYNPRIDIKGSTMPAYQYFFEKRKIGKTPSPDALKLPPEFAPAAGYEIVPKPETLRLVAYLQSLRTMTPLFEAPMTQLPQVKPAGDTNAPAGTNAPTATNAPTPKTNSPSTNTPAK
ncbi:MAG TPA: cbb3-type cytochrome c oxidase subunit II [Candidatus Acidoferrum sp.]|nr:cbb3-type cytochrome c oxidase subunit II [Candidatus Acidoferrum sp.]